MALPLGTPDTTAQSRVIQGLVAGIGFIGGGAILKAEGNVHGAATAAGIWTTGVVGVAVAQNRFLLALLTSFCRETQFRRARPLPHGRGSDPKSCSVNETIRARP